MDWITGISKAIDYIEEHITEPTDYARAAKEACSSLFNFQRVFALLCGYTLGDYVRMRRLTLAGEELLSTDAKVIDVALKYGYDSPESFSRAFTRFHGVSPSAVRKGAAIRSFSRICVKLILTGGSIMEYRIEKKQAAKIICRRREFTKPGDDYTNREIPTRCSPCAAGCQTRSGRPIERYAPNSSRRADMNTATALRLRSIPRRTCRTLTIPARYG